MNKANLFVLILTLAFSFFCAPADASGEQISTIKGGEYTVVVEGYDWGPAVSKVILSIGETVRSAQANDYSVLIKRESDCVELTGASASGERTVTYAYVSDAKGNKLASGKHITLLLLVGPDLVLGSPIQYSRNDKCRGNNWIDYHMIVTNILANRVWDTEVNRIVPLIDRFDLTGRYVHNKDLTMAYASFKPETSDKKSPLIIWLHGGGEGGTDPTIPLIANRAANYVSDEIQAIFGGAYVLVPQCPTAWMRNAEGATTRGKDNDIYNEGLMALIKDYVAKHPNIDADRIYVGGCSNGGYMTLKLVLLYPDYFAAAFPSALAYQSEYITDEQIQQIKDVPMWFMHSKDDLVTIAEKTVVPVYKRLMAAGAPDVHFSFFDHVVDITGFFGGENYHYSGHWSWIYSHANRAKLDFDGSPVTVDGRPVTVMEWVAAKAK